MARGNDREITFEIREHLGIIGKRNSGWTKELNIVSWNGQEPPKFDIRDWSPGHEKMGKGISLCHSEAERLKIFQRFCGISGNQNRI